MNTPCQRSNMIFVCVFYFFTGTIFFLICYTSSIWFNGIVTIFFLYNKDVYLENIQVKSRRFSYM